MRSGETLVRSEESRNGKGRGSEASVQSLKKGENRKADAKGVAAVERVSVCRKAGFQVSAKRFG